MTGQVNDNSKNEERETADRFFYDAAVFDPAVSGRRKPKMFSAAAWAMVAESDQNEAIVRAGHLVFAGARPDEALGLALDGMRRDIAKVEEPIAWVTALQLEKGWPGSARRKDGCYRTEVLELALMIEKLGDAEARVPGSVPDVVAHLPRWQDDQAFVAACRMAFSYSVAHWSGETPETEMPQQ